MAYTKQYFANGNVLSAEQLNNIENGVVQNETDIQNAQKDIQALKDSKNDETNPINPDLNLLVMGDSLFGSGNGKTWLRSVGCNMRNYGLSGASIARIIDRRRVDPTNAEAFVYLSVLNQWEDFKSGNSGDVRYDLDADRLNGNSNFKTADTDVILVDGGGNDYLFASLLGELTDSESKDESTVMGAIEKLFSDINKECPKARKFFLIMHRVFQCNEYTFSENKRRYWPLAYGYLRTKGAKIVDTNTGTATGEATQDWDIIFNQNKRPISLRAELDAAEKVFVRRYLDTPPASGNDYTWTRIDKASLYTDSAQTKLNTSLFKGQSTYDTLRANIINACNKYGFEVIDLYNVRSLNGEAPTEVALEPVKNTSTGVTWWAFKSPYTGNAISTGIQCVNKNGNNEEIHESIRNNAYRAQVANMELLDWDGIHPTVLGYQIGYEPYVKRALSFATKKKL